VVYGNGTVVAELRGRDEWKVFVDGREDPALARALTSLYADSYAGPQDGHYGQLILKDLAEQVGGTMTIRDFPAADAGDVN
jgi:hypothetical protein